MPLAIKTLNFNYECGSKASVYASLCMHGSLYFGTFEERIPISAVFNSDTMTSLYPECTNLGNVRCEAVSFGTVGAFGVSSVLYCVPSGRTAKVIPQIHKVEAIYGIYNCRRHSFYNWAPTAGTNEIIALDNLGDPGGVLSLVAGEKFCRCNTNSGYFCLIVGDKNILPAYNHICGSYSGLSCNPSQNCFDFTCVVGSCNSLSACFVTCVPPGEFIYNSTSTGTVIIADYNVNGNNSTTYGPRNNNYILHNPNSCAPFACQVLGSANIEDDDLLPYFYLNAGESIAVNFCNYLSNCAQTVCVSAGVQLRFSSTVNSRRIGEAKAYAAAGNYTKIQLQYIIIEEASA